MRQNLRLLGSRTHRGASLLIAILVFFLAALSGTVALTMSASNAGRYTHEKQEQQAYLFCASAAKLILNRLSNLEVVFKSKNMSAPVSSNEVEVILYKRKDGARAPLADTDKDLMLKDESFTTMLTDFALNAVMKPVEFCLYLDGQENQKVFVNIQRYGSNFNFDFWVQQGRGRDYQMSMSQILGAFDESTGVGGSVGLNFRQNTDPSDDLLDNYFYRILKFDVDKAAFTVGNLA